MADLLDQVKELVSGASDTAVTEPTDTEHTEAPQGDAQTAPEPDTEPKDAPEVPSGTSFDDALLDRAEQYGLTDEQIISFQTPAALEAALSAMDRRFAALGRNAAQRSAPPQKEPEPVQEAEPKVPRRAEKATSVDLAKYKETLDEDAYAAVEQVYNAMQGNHALLEKKVFDLYEQVSAQQRAVAAAAVAQQVDAMISDFGDDWKSTFGEKPTSQLQVRVERDNRGKVTEVSGPDRDAWIARNKLYTEAQALVLGYQESGMSYPGDREVGRRALRIAFGNDQIKRDRAKLREALQSRVNGATRRPTQRDIGEEKSASQREEDLIRIIEARRAKAAELESAARAAKKKKN